MDDAAPARIAGLEDIETIEARPYEETVPFRSVYDIFRRGAEHHRDGPALRFLPTGDPADPAVEVSYRGLLETVTRAANLFRARGVGDEDAVAMLLPPIPEAHYALWGAETAGRACPINFMLNPDHIAELIRAAGAKVLVALGPDPELDIWPKVEALRARCPELRAVLQVGGDPAGGDAVESFEAALAAQPGDRLAFDRSIGRETIAAYFHTGGTTGAPKLAQHTHGNQVHTSWSAALMYGLGPGDVMINGFPLFHVAGSFVYGTAVFAGGGTLVLPTRLGFRNQAFMRNYWRFVERERATMSAGVPTLVATLLATPVGDADISSMRVMWTGGSPLPGELAAAFERAMKLPVRNIFGMTECAGIVTITPPAAERVPGAAGFRLPYTEVRAVPLAPDGPQLDRTCGPGETGAIVLRGPHVSPGYTDAARNEGVFAGGWLISGDLGHIDAGGQVHVTGRAKDVIIRGGHNIDPAMIEEVLAAHPAVEMVAAIGEPDAYAGELPVAFVTLKPDAAADEAALMDFAAPRIAERPAVPKRITVLEAMPLTAVGKIYKPALRLRALERAFADALAPLAAEGVRIRVEGVEAGSGPSARVIVETAAERPAAEAAIARRLRDFAAPYELVWG